ncbi:VOC family protein [Paenibacillus sp. CF384]|uniref:VOC family protein n=1 Tax=Paenibacillus sp. CF384 TaxID=1884382 RepID=UPI00089598BD|nr:VOC family protein [Paenibacillus sp. CF384]SDW47535.1 glyoxalase family protein [Paenibacillus sp. CF384]
MTQTAGIHHITSFVRSPQLNVKFYSGVLDLRLVKKTINFDAPEVYHLYYEVGSPGTTMTFFPSKEAHRGRVGGGQVGYTTFAVPMGALGFWEERLASKRVEYERRQRFNETYLQFTDPDGLQLEIVEREAGAWSNWSFGGVPCDKAIKGLGGAILYSVDPEQTQRTLRHIVGLEKVDRDGGLVRYRAHGDIGNIIDINAEPMLWGERGAGTVHHIAWRARNDEDHTMWREQIINHGFNATSIINQQCFNAIYFREHGGILFEVATDVPDIVTNEPSENPMDKHQLPPWSVVHREVIEGNLMPI